MKAIKLNYREQQLSRINIARNFLIFFSFLPLFFFLFSLTFSLSLHLWLFSHGGSRSYGFLSCSDTGCDKAWRAGNDKAGNPKTCQTYIDKQWCTMEGGYGTKWNSKWGSFEDYADAEGNTALVCPQCGCSTSKYHCFIAWKNASKNGRMVQKTPKIAANCFNY